MKRRNSVDRLDVGAQASFRSQYAYPTSKKPYKTEKGSKCGKITVEPKEPISITNPTVVKICQDYRSYKIESKFLPQVIKTEVEK